MSALVALDSLRRHARAADPECLAIRRANFPDRIAFHAPGFRPFKTAEYATQKAREFVTISVTGSHCALGCDHCGTVKLKGMADLALARESVFSMCERAKEAGGRGVLISGGCDADGRVPLLRHVPDLVRVRRELGLAIRVHPGLVDEATAAGLAEVGIDGAMVDIIGHDDTIHSVYHTQATTRDYEATLANLEAHGVPAIPHIILGLHYGKMLGEHHALEMIAAHALELLVLVVLTPLRGTPMADVELPPLDAIGAFFEHARRRLPTKRIMLGCARPLGRIKTDIDRMAIHAGLNGIAYPAEGAVAEARSLGFEPDFYDACCGVQW
jgi:uncharacterized radical SAM superfamily protein